MVLRHPLGRTVTQTDKIRFTLLTANTNPIHFDAHYAAQTEFGRPLVNSTFTLKTCVKLITLHVRKDRFCWWAFRRDGALWPHRSDLAQTGGVT
jgi:acyl dehydratase